MILIDQIDYMSSAEFIFAFMQAIFRQVTNDALQRFMSDYKRMHKLVSRGGAQQFHTNSTAAEALSLQHWASAL